MLPGVIRVVQSSCRSKSHQTELGEVPRQLFPSKSISVKLISVQDGLSKRTVPPARPQDTTTTGRSRPQPYNNLSSGRADRPEAQSQMCGGGSPLGCLWKQARSCGRFSSGRRRESWCLRQAEHSGGPWSSTLPSQMVQLQPDLPRPLQHCQTLALAASLPDFAAPRPTQKPSSTRMEL